MPTTHRANITLSRFGYQCGCGRTWTRERYDEYGYDTGDFGIDVTDGDLVENLGDGIGIDVRTGQLEEDFGGIDVPLGDTGFGGW